LLRVNSTTPDYSSREFLIPQLVVIYILYALRLEKVYKSLEKVKSSPAKHRGATIKNIPRFVSPSVGCTKPGRIIQ
jgi:hypothetical protein